MSDGPRRPLKATWSDRGKAYEAGLDAWEEVRDLVRDIESQIPPNPPTMLQVWEEGGPSFSVGLGQVESLLTYEESLDPPYFASLGEAERAGLVQFSFGGELSEYPASGLISRDTAFAALEAFVRSRKMPAPRGFSWQEV